MTRYWLRKKFCGFVVHEQAGELRHGEFEEDPLPVLVWCSSPCVWILWEGEDYVAWWRVAAFPDFETEVFGEVGEAGGEGGL
jgi:hypothetical protein